MISILKIVILFAVQRKFIITLRSRKAKMLLIFILMVITNVHTSTHY